MKPQQATKIMGVVSPEWEYFWSTLILETKELAQEDVKMSQDSCRL